VLFNVIKGEDVKIVAIDPRATQLPSFPLTTMIFAVSPGSSLPSLLPWLSSIV